MRGTNAGEADKFDNLAKVALGKQLASENDAKSAQPSIQSQNEVVEKLKTGLEQMKVKLDELKTKRSQLIARQKTASAQQQVHDAVKSLIDIMDPDERDRPLRREIVAKEAKVLGQQELASSKPRRTVRVARERRRDDRDRGTPRCPQGQRRRTAQISDGERDDR